MKYGKKIFIFIFFLAIAITGHRLRITSAFAKGNVQKQNESKELLDRIDFGNAYIIGQTIKSGAVYLLQRKKSEIKSMLKYREDYRKEILENFHMDQMKIKKRPSH